MHRLLLSLILFVSLPVFAFGDGQVPEQDDRSAGNTPAQRLSPSNHSHSGSSPVHYPPATDKRVIADSGPGLDTGCTYRSGGPLVIEIPIKRVVGDVDANGKLLNPTPLITNGYLTKKAKITLPVFDIDQPSEVDHVYFNGEFLGQLVGSNGTWSSNTFYVDIDKVNFGRNAQGVNLPGINKLEVRIDQASGTAERWCMSVDWVMIEFDAVAPIFLIHGIASDGTSCWEDDVDPAEPYFKPMATMLESTGIPFSNKIDLEPNGRMNTNGFLLSNRLKGLAHQFGTRSCHLIVHSKGGNDIRDYLKNYYDPNNLKVLSLFTLSTPFHGSVMADVIDEGRSVDGEVSSNEAIKKLLAEDLAELTIWTSQVPQGEGLKALRPGNMQTFNASVQASDAAKFGGAIKFYNFGGDANLNNDPADLISSFENHVYPNVWIPPGSDGDEFANGAYRTLRYVAKIKVSMVTQNSPAGYPLPSYPTIEVLTPTTAPMDNDLAVTIESAKHPNGLFVGQMDRDHATIKSGDIGQGILSRIKADYQLTQP